MITNERMEDDTTIVRTSKYRWIILLIFCLYSSINFLQFLQYSIISNIMQKYYNVDSFSIDLTGLVFMIAFILFCVPANYIINRYNLRVVAILSSGLTAVGNLLKLLSLEPDRYVVVIVSQTLCAIAQVFMLCLPSKLASTWFGANEVSSACAFAILGTQIGIAIGCILPSHIIYNSDNIEQIGKDLSQLIYYNAGVSCVLFIIVICFFRAKPQYPPSQSQISIIDEQNHSVIESLKILLKNKSFLLLLLVFGMGNGIWTSFGLLINSIYLEFFPDSEEAVGIISCTSILMGGCVGSVVFGYLLDKTHKFRLISFISLLMSGLLFIVVLLILIYKVKMSTYFLIPLFSFFLASTLVISFEFASEMTYPISESISCAILNVAIYIFGIIFTLTFEALFDEIGYPWTGTIIVIILLLCAILSLFLDTTLRRRQANIN